MLINIFIISVVLYLFQSTYRPFLIPCYSIIHCIVFNFVITIVVLIFISKYLYHSFAMLLLLSLFLLNDRMWYGKTRVTSYELRVTSYELRVESLKARAEIQKHELKFKSTSYEFKSTCYKFQSTSSRIIKSLNH